MVCETSFLALAKLNLSTWLFVIRRMNNVYDMTTGKVGYQTLFESHLRYGITVSGDTTAENLQRVLDQQKRAVRPV